MESDMRQRKAESIKFPSLYITNDEKYVVLFSNTRDGIVVWNDNTSEVSLGCFIHVSDLSRYRLYNGDIILRN